MASACLGTGHEILAIVHSKWSMSGLVPSLLCVIVHNLSSKCYITLHLRTYFQLILLLVQCIQTSILWVREKVKAEKKMNLGCFKSKTKVHLITMKYTPHTTPDTYLFGPPSGTSNIGSVQEKLIKCLHKCRYSNHSIHSHM